MPRAIRAAMRPANSSCNCRAMMRPSMSSAAIVQNLNLLDADHRRVSPAFVQTFLSGDNDADAFVAAEIQVGGIGMEIVDRAMIVRADQFVFRRRLNTKSAANDALPLNDALRRRFVFVRSVGGCVRRF